MKRSTTTGDPLAFDLERIPPRERSSAWSRWVPGVFSALEVIELARNPVGLAHGVSVGAGMIWRIVSSSQRLRSTRRGLTPDSRSALLLQRRGTSQISQTGRECRLNAGDFALIDSTLPFTLDLIGMTEVVLVDFPHVVAGTSFPAQMTQSATAVSGASGEAQLLRRFLEALLECAGSMQESGGEAAWHALLRLIGGLPAAEQGRPRPIPRRLRQAFADIEQLLEEPALCAELLAQRQDISRRQLDSLFVEHTGRTVAAQILERRLAQTAADLSDAQLAHLSVTAIAYRAGFKDSAHFTRAFRQRFGCTPTAWRRAALPTA